MIAASSETVAKTVGRFNLIANYGLFWRLGDTEWTDGHFRLVGNRAGRKPANFWKQDGIYILYSKRQVHYVGVSHQLGHRLRVHTKDRHKDKWDEFHWFGFRRVSNRADQKGFLELEARMGEPKVKTWRVRGDIEAVLGLSIPCPGLIRNPNFGAKGVEKWEQMPAQTVAEHRARWKRKQLNHEH